MAGLFEGWKWLPDEKPAEKGYDYLVALPDEIDKNVLYPMIAQWHEAGDVILLNRHMEEAPAELSEKEKLLRLIKYGLFPYTVATSGFYVLSTDKDVPEEFAVKGCEQYLEYLGNELFWAKVPSMPDGYVSADEHEYEEQLSINERMKRQHDERIEYLRSQAKTDNYISQLKIGEIADGVNHDFMLFCGTKYSIPSVQYAESICAARKMLDVAKNITDDEINKLSELQEQGNSQEALLLIDEIFARAGITDMKHRNMLVYILCNARNDMFVNYRAYYCARYRNDRSKFIQILTQAKLKRDTIHRILYRFRKIVAAEAPEIILLNEFRIFAQEFAAFCSPECITGIDEESFGRHFHVDANGNYYDYKDYDYEPGCGIGKDFPYFAVQTLPNYMMFEKGWCIRDNRSSYSFIFDDNGKPFMKWEDARRKADELTRNLLASAPVH